MLTDAQFRDETADIIRRYRAGETCKEIGDDIGLSRQAINQRLVRAGEEMRPARPRRRRIPANGQKPASVG